MKTVRFATGNSRKIAEATETLAPYGIAVETLPNDIDEIQHRDPAEIAKAKARAAFALAGEPVVVADTCWDIPALGGFPGGYMKDVAAWLEPADLMALMDRHEDKTIYCNEHVAYCDGETLQHFVSTYKGRFIDEPRGRVHEEESFEQLVIMYGDKTIAEILADGDIALAGESLDHWKQFGEWFSQK